MWFDCSYAFQRYEDPTGTYAAVQVGYEEGVATELAFEAIPGTGDFDPKAALRSVGLILPGNAKLDKPAEGVQRWSWFNSEARLLVHDLQYRVEVTVIDGQWARSQVRVTLNHPLSAEQKARIRVVDAKPNPDTPKEPTPSAP